MAKDFRKATDELFATVTHEDLADALDCSVATIRQARRSPGTPSSRNPPKDWEDGVRKLAQAQADHFTRLVKKLTSE